MELKLQPYTYPQCEHAHLILNRAALSMMMSDDCYYSDSRLRFPSECALLRFGQSVKDYEKYYVVLDGRAEYVFLLVRCGRCSVCRHAKMIDLINRVNMESGCYSSPCYMITLTYDNEHLPCKRLRWLHGINTLYYPDVQNFFKRLRIAWTRAGLNHNIRYLVAGEYGKLHQRPHWHILLWNNPYKCGELDSPFMATRNVLLNRKLKDDVFRAWNMCNPDCFQCEPAGDGAGAYVAKYLRKQSGMHLCDGRAAPMIRCSSRNGGIGAPMVIRHAAYYSNNPSLQQFTYRAYDGSVVSCPITAFISQKLFKSPSRQIPSKYRQLFASLVDVVQHLIDCDLMSSCDARQLLNSYRLRCLYYRLDVRPVHRPIPSLEWLDVRARLLHCFESLIEELDIMLDEIDVDYTNYYMHKLNVVPSEDNRGNLAFTAARANDELFKSLSKEVL